MKETRRKFAKGMHQACIFALAVPVLFATTAHSGAETETQAQSLAQALEATSSFLAVRGGGLSDRYEACPGNDQTEWGFEFVSNVELKPIDVTRTAVLIDTRQCSGGNAHGQYLAIATSTEASLVLTNIIGDMSFIVDRFYVEGETLLLEGSRWLEDDPHCCPSQTGQLTYDLSNDQVSFYPD